MTLPVTRPTAASGCNAEARLAGSVEWSPQSNCSGSMGRGSGAHPPDRRGAERVGRGVLDDLVCVLRTNDLDAARAGRMDDVHACARGELDRILMDHAARADDQTLCPEAG